MILRRLILTGFGKFAGREIELEDGLNVFYGPNESGKTTIQSFLKGMLYGFKEPDARRRRWTAELERWAPWSGQPYSGALEFATREGRVYIVERSFPKDQDRVQIFDAITGRDVSTMFALDARRERLFAEEFTGMNELVFSSTVCISDMPDGASEKGRQELAARLANLQESADEATSVRRAFDILENARRDLVTRQNKLEKQEAEKRQALETIFTHRGALRGLELRLRELGGELAGEEAVRKEALAALLALDITALQQKLAVARKLEAEIDALATEVALLAPYAEVPVHLLEEIRQLQTRIEEGEENRLILTVQATELGQELERAEQELAQLPGAVGLVAAMVADEAYAEEVRAVAARLTEAFQNLREAEQALRQAQSTVEQANAELTPYQGLVDLPADASHIMTELDACVRQASSLSESLQAQSRRRRILAENLHNYEDRVRTVLRQVVDLEIMVALPDNADRRMEEMAAEAEVLARDIEEASHARDDLLQEALDLEAESNDRRWWQSLPEDFEGYVNELELRVRSGEQRVAAVRTLVDQLQAATEHREQRVVTLQSLEEKLARSEHLADLTLSEVHAAEGWLLRWKSADEDLVAAIGELNAAEAAGAAIRAELGPLEAVGSAGLESLTRAEQLAKQETEARERAQQAAISAEAVKDPAPGRMRAGGALMCPGFFLALAAVIGAWPAVYAWVGVVLFLLGVPLLVTFGQQKLQVMTERNRYYNRRSEATASAEKINAELRSLLSQVRQPSVVAWRRSWNRFVELHEQQVAVKNRLALARQRRAAAGDMIARAREAVHPLPAHGGIRSSDRKGAAQLVEALKEAVLARQEQLRRRSALQEDLHGDEKRLRRVYDDTVRAIHLLFPEAEPPLEVDLSWAQQMLAQADEGVGNASCELAVLLTAAEVDNPAALLHKWRRQQALVLRQAAAQKEAEEKGKLVEELLSRRRPLADRIRRWLEMAGIYPAACALPWSKEDIELFGERYRRSKDLRAEMETMPQRLPSLLRDARQLLDELRREEEMIAELKARLDTAMAAMPSFAVPMLEAAVTGEETVTAFLTAVGTGLPTTLWPEELDELLSELPSVGAMDRFCHEVAAIGHEARAMLSGLLAQAEADDPGDFRRRWQEYERVRHRVADAEKLRELRQEAQRDRLTYTRTLLAQEVEPFLAAAGVAIPDTQGPVENIDIWREALEDAFDRLAAVQEAYGLKVTIEAELEKEHELLLKREESLSELKGWQEELLDQAKAENVEVFEQWCEQHASWQQAHAQLEGRKQQLAAALSGTTLAEIQAQLQARQEEWSALTGLPHERAVPTESGRTHWEERLAEAEEAVGDLREERAEILGDMKSHTAACGKEERVAAELGSLQQEQKQVHMSLEALHLARQELELASEEVHRQFAPVLNAQASDILHTLTRGRYERLAVSDTLEITLSDPVYGRQVSLDAVSHGTCDQVYLAFRLAAAEAICGDSWAPPLILDDAFAHYDDYRVQEALEALMYLSERVQVLFFTCRKRELDILHALEAETGISKHVIELA